MHNSHGFNLKTGRGSSSSMPPKRTTAPPDPQQQQWQYPAGYDYQSYYAAWQNYQSQNPYYNYDQSYASYGTGYQYQSPPQFGAYQAYQAPPPTTLASQPAVAVEAAPLMATAAATTVAAVDTEKKKTAPTTPASTQQYTNVPYDNAETFIEEHEIPLDIEVLNKEAIQRNDDLYDSLEESRWLPADTMDAFIKVK